MLMDQVKVSSDNREVSGSTKTMTRPTAAFNITNADPESQQKNGHSKESDPLIRRDDGINRNSEQHQHVSRRRSANPTPPIRDDIRSTLQLSVPIFSAMLSWVGMKTTDSAILGHVSVQALSAASLSDIWTMCTAVLIQARVLGFLCSAAIGAGNPSLAGIYLQVSYAVLGVVCILVFGAWSATEYVWDMMGADPTLAHWAGYYARVLALGIPGQLAFAQLAQFFSSQRIMHPEMNVAALALATNLLFGLFFVLGIPFPSWHGFGFAACPIVTVSVVYIQICVMWYVYVYRQQLHKKCWGDGWNWHEITRARIHTFCELYIPAALGMASDFWRVAIVGTIAAHLGEVELSVFNTSYRIMWIVLIMVSAVTSASGIQLSQRLGAMDYIGARQAGYVGLSLSAMVLVLVGMFVLIKIRWFGRLFTNDKEFLDLFEEARWPFAVTLVLMNISVAIERIPYAMGRTKEVFWYGFMASWGAQVPAVYVLVEHWRNDLVGLYWGMAAGYSVLAVMYSYITYTSDWKFYAELARARAESPQE